MFKEELKIIKTFERVEKAYFKRSCILLSGLCTFAIVPIILKMDIIDYIFNEMALMSLITLTILFGLINLQDYRNGLFALPRKRVDFLLGQPLIVWALYLERFYGYDKNCDVNTMFFGFLNRINREENIDVLTKLLNLKIVNDEKRPYLKKAVLESIEEWSLNAKHKGSNDIEKLERCLLIAKEESNINKIEESLMVNS